MLTTIAWGIGDRVEYALEGSIFNAGSAIKWLRDDLGLITSAREVDALAESRAGRGRRLFCLRVYRTRRAALGHVCPRRAAGLTRATTKAHFARAVLEGIAFQIRDLVETMEKDAGVHLCELKVDGGASVSNIMMQIQADLLNARVNRPKCGVHGAGSCLPCGTCGRRVHENAGHRGSMGKRPHLYTADRVF